MGFRLLPNVKHFFRVNCATIAENAIIPEKSRRGIVTRPSRKTRFSRKNVQLSRKILSQKKSEGGGGSYDSAEKLYIPEKQRHVNFPTTFSETRTPTPVKSRWWKWTITYSRPFREKLENVGFCCYCFFFVCFFFLFFFFIKNSKVGAYSPL